MLKRVPGGAADRYSVERLGSRAGDTERKERQEQVYMPRGGSGTSWNGVIEKTASLGRVRAGKMAHWVKVPTTKPDDLN